MNLRYRLLRIRSILTVVLIPITQLPPAVFAEDVMVVQEPTVQEVPFIPGPILEEYVVQDSSSNTDTSNTTSNVVGGEEKISEQTPAADEQLSGEISTNEGLLDESGNVNENILDGINESNTQSGDILTGTVTGDVNSGDIIPVEFEQAPIIPSIDQSINLPVQEQKILEVVYPETIPYFDDIGRFDPNSIDSVTTVGGDETITYCSLIARSNIEKILLLGGWNSFDLSVQQGDAFALIEAGIRDNSLLEVTRQNLIAQLDMLFAENGSTVFDIYALKADEGLSNIERGHRFVAVMGTNNLWYALDPLRGLQTIDAQDMYSYIARYPDDERIFIKHPGYNPIFSKDVIAVNTGVVISSGIVTVTIPEGTIITKEDIGDDSTFKGIEDFVINDDVLLDSQTLLPIPDKTPILSSVVQSNQFAEDVVSDIPASVDNSTLIANPVENVPVDDAPISLSETNPIVDIVPADILLSPLSSIQTIDTLLQSTTDVIAPQPDIQTPAVDSNAGIVNADSAISGEQTGLLIEAFEIGDMLSHLMFSKPVKVDVQTQFPEGQEVSIGVLHEGDTEYGTLGITTNPDATCVQGVSSEENSHTKVQNGQIQFYTCGASAFLVSMTSGGIMLTLPMSGTQTVFSMPVIQATGSVVGATGTISFSGGAIIATGNVSTDGYLFLRPTTGLGVGIHEICGGINCITLTVNTYYPTTNTLSSFFTGAFATVAIAEIQEQPDGNILLVGAFTTMNGVTRNRIARLTSTGVLDETFTGSFGNAYVSGVALTYDGKVLVAGNFTTMNGITRNRIARLTSTGALDPTFTGAFATGSYVTDIIGLPNGKVLIAGNFTTINGVTKSRLARLTHTGLIDNVFTGYGTINAQVNKVLVQDDGKIIIGGNFTTVNGVTRNRIARLTTTGLLDTSFTGSFANVVVNDMALLPDGKLLVAGNFTTMNGVTRNRIARLTTTGALDPTFTGSFAGNEINSLLLLPDGNVMIGGLFTGFNGVVKNRVARLTTTGLLDNTFTGGFVTGGTTVRVVDIKILSNSSLLLGGIFTSFSGVNRGSLVNLGAYNYSYIGSAGGSVSGQVQQYLVSGATTTLVTAVSDVGYVFSGWSDGNTGESRQDLVTGEQSITAYFSPLPSSSITQPLSGSIFNTAYPWISGTGTVDGSVVTLTYGTGGATIGTAVIANGMWTVVPTSPGISEGTNEICVNSGSSCITITITGYVSLSGGLDETFTGEFGSDEVFPVVYDSVLQKVMVGGWFGGGAGFNGQQQDHNVRLTLTGATDPTFTGFFHS